MLVTGRFAPSSVRPWAFCPQEVSPHGRIQRFLLIQLRPYSRHSVHNLPGGEMSWGQNVKGRTDKGAKRP